MIGELKGISYAVLVGALIGTVLALNLPRHMTWTMTLPPVMMRIEDSHDRTSIKISWPTSWFAP